jgi:hypothetical protein
MTKSVSESSFRVTTADMTDLHQRSSPQRNYHGLLTPSQLVTIMTGQSFVSTHHRDYPQRSLLSILDESIRIVEESDMMLLQDENDKKQ